MLPALLTTEVLQSPSDARVALTKTIDHVAEKFGWADGVKHEWYIHAAIRSVAYTQLMPSWEEVIRQVEFAGIDRTFLHIPPVFRRVLKLPCYLHGDLLTTVARTAPPAGRLVV